MSGRKANLTIALEDKPGQLQRVAEIVSRCGSNVVSVLHLSLIHIYPRRRKACNTNFW